MTRVGTHAIRTASRSTLWRRLHQHRGHADGGGNHRGSIFRLHVGAALLKRDEAEIGALPTWGYGDRAPKEIREGERDHEQRVSRYIGAMNLLWLDVPDEPGRDSLRAYIERNAIALLSNRLAPADPPSDGWLGRYSPQERISKSGLWNLNHVDQAYDPQFLSVMEQRIEAMAGTPSAAHQRGAPTPVRQSDSVDSPEMEAPKPNDAAPPPFLSNHFDDALRLAHDYHRTQLRKGTNIPYFSHLIQVAGLVVEAGGDETQAIAALLHDAIEDSDTVEAAREREREIESRFGPRVLELVKGCTDGDPAEKKDLSWRDRKERYLAHLRRVEDELALISICDKLHNARAILHDLRQSGRDVWKRFNVGQSDTLWYYRELSRAYDSRPGLPFADEFREVVQTIVRDSERGSRKHLLDWLESPRFVPQLNRLLEDTGALVSDMDAWAPTGWSHPEEPRLDRWGPMVLPDLVDWEGLRSWWLVHERGANVPNWDLAATCKIDGQTGLVLVEAKAQRERVESRRQRSSRRALVELEGEP